MTASHHLDFNAPDILTAIDGRSDEFLDDLPFGVIGFDAVGLVRRYNRFESVSSGLPAASVVDSPFFLVVAPCMNNYLVAQRFEDAAADGTTLDATIPYILTHRMRPLKVHLRLLAAKRPPMRYVLVERRV
jgi:photoactive yellow protein